MSDWMPANGGFDPAFDAELRRLFGPSTVLQVPADLLEALRAAIAVERAALGELRPDWRLWLKILLSAVGAVALSLGIFWASQTFDASGLPGWLSSVQGDVARTIGLPASLVGQLLRLLPGLVPLALAPLAVVWAMRAAD